MVKRIGVLCLIFICLQGISASEKKQSMEDPYILANYSSAALIKYLQTDSSLSEYDKAKAIWDWIYNNINYDIIAYENGKVIPINPDYTLSRRKTMCEGYAVLFNYFAKYAGLKSVLIEGYVKDQDYYLQKNFVQANHAWNAVRIDGTWKLLDASWGGCVIIQKEEGIVKLVSKVLPIAAIHNNVVIKQQNNQWFLMQPDSFIFTHLPIDPVWQLLECMVPFKAFISSSDSIAMYVNANIVLGCDTLMYIDSLNQFFHTNKAGQDYISGLRAFDYNPQYYRAAGHAYARYSKYNWNVWQGLTRRPVNERLVEINKINEGFTQAKNYYILDREQVKQKFKQLAKLNNSINKQRVKTFSSYIKKNKAILEKNKKNIKKSKEIKRNYAERINLLKKQNNDLLFDDKIYDVKRTKIDPTPDKVAQIAAYFYLINKNDTDINSIKDTLKLNYDLQFSEQVNDYRNTINTIKTLTDSSIVYTNNYMALINSNNFMFLDEMNNFQLHIAANRDSIAILRKKEVESEKLLLKDGSKELLEKYTKIFALIKYNKNLLKEIKKLSIIDRDEEALYDIENEKLINENNELINRYNTTYQQVAESKDNILHENQIIKAESKNYKRLIRCENLRFKEESRREEVRYKFYSKTSNMNLNSCKQYIVDVNKAARILQASVNAQSK